MRYTSITNVSNNKIELAEDYRLCWRPKHTTMRATRQKPTPHIKLSNMQHHSSEVGVQTKIPTISELAPHVAQEQHRNTTIETLPSQISQTLSISHLAL